MAAPFTLGRQDIIKQNLLIKTSKHVIFIVKIVGKTNKQRVLKPFHFIAIKSLLRLNFYSFKHQYGIDD